MASPCTLNISIRDGGGDAAFSRDLKKTVDKKIITRDIIKSTFSS